MTAVKVATTAAKTAKPAKIAILVNRVAKDTVKIVIRVNRVATTPAMDVCIVATTVVISVTMR